MIKFWWGFLVDFVAEAVTSGQLRGTNYLEVEWAITRMSRWTGDRQGPGDCRQAKAAVRGHQESLGPRPATVKSTVL